MIYSFTGPHRDLSPRERELIDSIVGSLRDPTGLRFGGALGVDTAAAVAAADHWYAVPRVIIAPAAPWSGVVPPGTRVLTAAPGRDDGDAYMKRNTALVAAPCEVLIAFPETGAEPRNPRAGGGTWATVRRARKRGLPIYVFPLDGGDPYVNLRGGRTLGVDRHMPRTAEMLVGVSY